MTDAHPTDLDLRARLVAAVGHWLEGNFGLNAPRGSDERWLQIESQMTSVIEEMGELARAILKRYQGVRATTDWDAEIDLEIGDVAVTLFALGRRLGVDLDLDTMAHEIVFAPVAPAEPFRRLRALAAAVGDLAASLDPALPTGAGPYTESPAYHLRRADNALSVLASVLDRDALALAAVRFESVVSRRVAGERTPDEGAGTP